MDKIGHVRIDDRLIHGQIVASWISVLGCNTIVVADDKAAGDPLQSMLLEMAVPPGIKLKILKVADAAAWLNSPEAERPRTLMVLRDVVSALALVDQGVELDEINVGNVSANPKKTKYSKSVWLDEQDIENFRSLRDKGIYLEVRVVPSEKGTDLFSMVK